VSSSTLDPIAHCGECRVVECTADLALESLPGQVDMLVYATVPRKNGACSLLFKSFFVGKQLFLFFTNALMMMVVMVMVMMVMMMMSQSNN